VRASASGTTITLSYTEGADGNRFAMYSYTCSTSGGAATAAWDAAARQFAGGTSPTKWRVTLDFSSLEGPGLIDPTVRAVPTDQVRKMRWTYAADLQSGDFERSEFEVVVSNWSVTGTNRGYSVAGPGSRRFENHDPAVSYEGSWSEGAETSPADPFTLQARRARRRTSLIARRRITFCTSARATQTRGHRSL
jgi:hypothetical protein